jgi:hypothetical protein
VRDPIYAKETKTIGATAATEGDVGGNKALSGPAVNFGYESIDSTTVNQAAWDKVAESATEDQAYYAASPQILLPNFQAYQTPIVSRVGKLERTGHRITGSCKFFTPPLSIIKAWTNYDNCTAFSEVETYDAFFDIERTIHKPADVVSTGLVGTPSNHVVDSGLTIQGFEVDRLQFKVKGDQPVTSIKITGASGVLEWTGVGTISNSVFTTFDVPLRNISASDTTSYYYNGSRIVLTATTASLDIDQTTIASLDISFSDDCTIELKDIYLYKACEWRVETIKDYRDEYMAIGAVRVRGDRTSRRRAYG